MRDELLFEITAKASRVEMDLPIGHGVIAKVTYYYSSEWYLHVMDFYSDENKDRSIWGTAEEVRAELVKLGVLEAR